MMGLGETVIIFDPEDIKEMYRYGKRMDDVNFGIKKEVSGSSVLVKSMHLESPCFANKRWVYFGFLKSVKHMIPA